MILEDSSKSGIIILSEICGLYSLIIGSEECNLTKDRLGSLMAESFRVGLKKDIMR